MSLLAAPALLLLLAIPALLWLALHRTRPARLEAGTLFIWRRVAQQAPASRKATRRLEPLLWLLLACAILAGLGAARPGVMAQQTPRAAVFIERIGAGQIEPQLEDALGRARAAAEGAKLEVYMAGGEAPAQPDVRLLAPGAIEAQLAQFEARTRDVPARILLLCAPHPTAQRLGLVLPRLTAQRRGVLHDVGVQGEQIVARSTPGGALEPRGLAPVDSRAQGDDVLTRYTLSQPLAEITDSHGNRVTIRRAPFVVGVGGQWSSRRHRALYAALNADAADEDPPAVWLGSAEFKPALRLNAGAAAQLDQAEISYDAGHALFADLPLGGIDWRAGNRVLARDSGRRPLVSASRDGATVGDLVQLDENDNVLVFAADPFESAPIAESALLLDNAIGVLLGQRPSAMPRATVSGDLPTRRAAHAAPFETQGQFQTSTVASASREFASWLLILAALAAVAASASVSRRPQAIQQ
ncbi:MAG: hypothetical protein KF696_09105 [Planctomycetes bacterium]|nr:hypothetical protein [Planctomycetota bacterium]MCW8136744.1 hypothetical protein [Planctomycetota bacterium]